MIDLHDNIARLVIGSTSVSHHHRILPMFPSSQYLLHLGRIYRINN